MGSRPKPWTTNQMGSHRKSHSIPERGTQLWPLPHRENVDISNLPQPRLPKPTEWTSSEVQTPEETPAGSSGWGHLIQISILWVGLGCRWFGAFGAYWDPVQYSQKHLQDVDVKLPRSKTTSVPFPRRQSSARRHETVRRDFKKSWGNYYYYLWPPIMAGATLYQE